MMPLHPDFQKVLSNMIDKYGPEKGKKVFYAWVNDHRLDDTKPLAGQKVKEENIMETKEAFYPKGQGLKIKGVAISAGLSKNGVLYLDEVLKKFAPYLKDAPIYYEHPESGKSVAQVTDSQWIPEKRHIEYEAEVFDIDAAERIKRGLIKNVSIFAGYRQVMDPTEITVPVDLGARNPKEVHLGLVVDPGDPSTSIETVLEHCVIESFRLPTVIDPKVKQFNEQIKAVKPKPKVEPQKTITRTAFGNVFMDEDNRGLRGTGEVRLGVGYKRNKKLRYHPSYFEGKRNE